MPHSFETDWTREEFKAYLLLFAANANYFETEDEKEQILTLVDAIVYKRIHKELDHDNDYQSIQKILYNVEKFHYSKDDLNSLIGDIQNVFDANGEHDLLEDNLLLALKKLLK
ncbi:MAG: hypothetical protein RI883_889 [Bacteroidota bacterium]|jgi:hypothetical protein